MRKNNLTIFFGIFLVGMLFVPASISTTLAQDSEIPSWIKNNAGWWADDQIDDVSFLKGIEYLLDNLIIQIPSNQQITPNSGLLQLDKFAYELPKRSGTTEVNISGKFENWSGSSVSIDITRPDGKIDELSTRSSTGSFEYAYIIKSDFPLGNYQLSAKSVNVQLGMVSFKLNAQSDQSEKSIPVWVRNNAGWWADGQIDDSSFVSGLQFLIKEGIIKVQYKKVDKNASFAPGIDDNLIMYQTKLPTAVVSKGVFSAIVIHATHNDYCSNEENKITAAYGKMTEHLLKKTIRENPTQVLAVCMKLDVIKESSYPLTLKELGANRSSIMIFVGDLEANFESYMVNDALGWWKCEADYTSKWAFKGCGTHIIVVCDECTRDDFPDPKDTTTNGMVILAHEIGHHNLFEDGFGPGVWSTSLHNAQFAIDYCDEGNVLPSNMCKKLKEPVTIMGKTYPVMNINFIKNQWKKIDIIMEEDKMTSWFDCKRSNYENGITRICGPGISSTQDSSEDNVQPTQRDLATEQKVPEPKRNFIAENPRLVDRSFDCLTCHHGDGTVAQVKVGQEVGVASDVTNKLDRNWVSYIYAVEVKDDKGKIENTWSFGVVMEKETTIPALPWIPKDAGHYTITISFYKNFQFPEKQVMITEPLTLEINVVDSSGQEAAPAISIETNQSIYEYGDHLIMIINVSEITGDDGYIYIIDPAERKNLLLQQPISQKYVEFPSNFPFDSAIWKPGTYVLEFEYSGDKSSTQFTIEGTP